MRNHRILVSSHHCHPYYLDLDLLVDMGIHHQARMMEIETRWSRTLREKVGTAVVL